MVHDQSKPGAALVIRSFALPVEAFDYLKDCQRRIQQAEGLHLTNGRLLARLLMEHKAMTASAGR